MSLKDILSTYFLLTDEGLTLETSALKLSTVVNFSYQLSW